MRERPEFARLILSFNPYRFIACFAIFHVVGSDATRDAADASGPSVDHQLLGNFIDEAALANNLYTCGISNSDGVLKPQEEPGYGTLDFLVEDIIEDLRVEAEIEDDVASSLKVDAEENRFPNIFDDTVKRLSPVVDRIQSDTCRKHSRIFLQQLRRYKMWALQMYDSSAKLPPGVLSGNVNQLGDFDQCLSVSAIEGRARVTGQYCLALIDVAAEGATNETASLADAVDRAQAYGFIRSTVNDPGHFIPQFTSINWAVCLPSSCSKDDLQVALTDILNSIPGLRFTVRVEPEMCYVKENKPFSIMTLTTLCGFGFIIGVAITATLRDGGVTKNVCGTAGKLERMMMAFSLKKNWDALVAELPTEGDIHCIHGVRAICTLMLYVAHKLIPISSTPLTNRSWLTELSNEPVSILLRASLIYTDSFLLLSGVLTAYNLGKEMQRTGTIQWTKRYIARFIRLTPALVALVVFYAYILEHLGSGPLWGRVVQQNADICKKGLWTNILYIQNFFPFENMCATHTHQLALDMQLFVLTPILVYLLYKCEVGGAIVIVALHAAIAALRYYVTIKNQLSLLIYHGMTIEQLFRTANLCYSLSAHRATPYLMGVVVGYILYRYEKHINIPKPAVIAGWFAAAACCYLSVFSSAHAARRDFPYNVVEAANYAAYSPVTWSLALGWAICACALGYGGALNKILCWKGLVFLSRISYSMYLTQFAVFFYNVGTLRGSQEFLLAHAVSLEEFFVVVLVSIIMTLLFDLPMQEVKGILTGSGPRQSTKER